MTASRGTVLITGTSSGIGLATAIAAARSGFTTVATMRDPDRSGTLREEAERAGVTVEIRRLDVTDDDSINGCFHEVRDAHGGVDAVVNNAGISNFDPTLEMSTMEALRANLEVNFFGVIAVSRAAMPLLRASRGRLLAIGSVHGIVGQPFNEAYAAAKFAVEGFLESLAPVAAAHGVRVSVVVPGYVNGTSFGRFPDISLATIQAASGPYAGTFANYAGWVKGPAWKPAGQSTWTVADVVVRALLAEAPPFRIPTSDWVRTYVAAKLADGDGSAIQSLARTWIGGVEPRQQQDH